MTEPPPEHQIRLEPDLSLPDSRFLSSRSIDVRSLLLALAERGIVPTFEEIYIVDQQCMDPDRYSFSAIEKVEEETLLEDLFPDTKETIQDMPNLSSLHIQDPSEGMEEDLAKHHDTRELSSAQLKDPTHDMDEGSTEHHDTPNKPNLSSSQLDDPFKDTDKGLTEHHAISDVNFPGIQDPFDSMDETLTEDHDMLHIHSTQLKEPSNDKDKGPTDVKEASTENNDMAEVTSDSMEKASTEYQAAQGPSDSTEKASTEKEEAEQPPTSGSRHNLQPKARSFTPAAWQQQRNVITIRGISHGNTLATVLSSIKDTGRILDSKLERPRPDSRSLVATVIFTQPRAAAVLVKRGLSIQGVPVTVAFHDRPFFHDHFTTAETRVLRIAGPSGLVTMPRLEAMFGQFRSVEPVEMEANWHLNSVEHVITWYFAGIEQCALMVHHLGLDRTFVGMVTLTYMTDPCE